MDCQTIFDVKLDGFCQKAMLAPGGNNTVNLSSALTNLSVSLREMVHIAFTVALFSDLQVKRVMYRIQT